MTTAKSTVTTPTRMLLKKYRASGTSSKMRWYEPSDGCDGQNFGTRENSSIGFMSEPTTIQ